MELPGPVLDRKIDLVVDERRPPRRFFRRLRSMTRT